MSDEKRDKRFQDIWRKIFDWLYDAIKKMNYYLVAIKDNLSKYISPSSKHLMELISALSQGLINMCCAFTTDNEIWNQLKNLYKECIDSKIIINAWQLGIEKTTHNLISALTNISQQDFDILRPLNPFKELPIMKEYILQILLNAYKSSDAVYNKLKERALYSSAFEVWMKLFGVINVVQELSNKVLLLEYSRGKG
jgi:hypothetical protein